MPDDVKSFDDDEKPEEEKREGVVKLRLISIERRLSMKQAGIPPALYSDDFDEWAVDDIHFLLESPNNGNHSHEDETAKRVAAFRALSADTCRNLQPLSESIENAQEATDGLVRRVGSLLRQVRGSRRNLNRMYAQVGMFIDPRESQVVVTLREELEALQSDEEKLELTISTQKIEAERQRDRLNQVLRDNEALLTENNTLKGKIAALPATYLQRLLAEGPKLPSWVIVGNRTQSTTLNISGKIIKVTYDSVIVAVPQGDIQVRHEQFMKYWRQV